MIRFPSLLGGDLVTIKLCSECVYPLPMFKQHQRESIFDVMPDIVKYLMNSDTLYVHLTGSRALGVAKVNSDWDFYLDRIGYALDSALIEKLGFIDAQVHPDSLYGGVTKVLVHNKEDVHLLIVDNVLHRHRVQATVQLLLNKYYPEGYTDKDTQSRELWSHADKIVSKVCGNDSDMDNDTPVSSPISVLNDGSAFFTTSTPLPKDHWIYQSQPKPNPINTTILQTVLGSENWYTLEGLLSDRLSYTLQECTRHGQEMDFDPDAVLQTFASVCFGGRKAVLVNMNTNEETTDD